MLTLVEMEKTDYSQRLTQLMAEKHWEAADVARRLKVSSVAVHKVLEKGGNFGVDTLFAAAKLFNVSPYWLHTGEGARGHWRGPIEPGAQSLVGGGVDADGAYRPSDDALQLGRFYDTLPRDEELRRSVWRRASSILLRLDHSSDTPQSAPPDPVDVPKISRA